MSKNSKKTYNVIPKKEESNVVFSQSGIEKALKEKPYIIPGFRTGSYMTEKDRPRKKWSVKDLDL